MLRQYRKQRCIDRCRSIRLLSTIAQHHQSHNQLFGEQEIEDHYNTDLASALKLNQEIKKKYYISLKERLSDQQLARDKPGHFLATKTIVVVSPHPDDDVIGMGGSMALWAQDPKIKIYSIYFTDGAGSLRAGSEQKIIQQREYEAISALKIIGAEGAFFLRCPSYSLKQQNTNYHAMIQDLIQILVSLKPQEIYVTTPFEKHPTHLRCSEAICKILVKIQNQLPENFSLYGYNVWGPIVYQQKNILSVDITKVVEQKKLAILAHAGEVSYKDYAGGVIARNYENAIFQNSHQKIACRYLEQFLNMTDCISCEKGLQEYAKQEMINYLKEIWL